MLKNYTVSSVYGQIKDIKLLNGKSLTGKGRLTKNTINLLQNYLWHGSWIKYKQHSQ